MLNNDYVLEMNHITKSFPGVKAIDDVSFNLKKGELHSLIGENGAGKSTLMKVLGGINIPEAGEIRINNQEVHINSPIDSIRNKIGIIYQEFNLVPTISISENIFLGREPRYAAGIINRKEMLRQTQALMSSLGLDNLDCSQQVEKLSIAQQQMVEIAKALFYDSGIIIMDEPTAVLTEKESTALFHMIELLKRQGTSIIYISHRLEEVQTLSDRITILRDGKFIIELDNKDRSVQKETMVKYMVGRELTDYFPAKTPKSLGKPILKANGLTKAGLYHNVNFELHQGEILGFFGLVGAGRTEVMKTLFGEIKPDEGFIEIDGLSVSIRNPSDAVYLKIALIPEDRKHEGLILSETLTNNIALTNTATVSRYGMMSTQKKLSLAKEYIHSLEIRPSVAERLAEQFSGGNQQKIVIAKWLAKNPKIIIMDEPTRGIDIGAKREIYDIIQQLTKKGVSIIVVSSEMLEVMGICDRIIVMYEGKITGEFENTDISQEQLMAYASGIA